MIVAGGMGVPGGLIASYGYGATFVLRIPVKAIPLIGADPSARILVSADGGPIVLFSADPSVTVLDGREVPC